MYSQKFYNLDYFDAKELLLEEWKAKNLLQQLEIPDFLGICNLDNDISEIRQNILNNYEQYVIFGTGGSSLIGQTIKEITATEKLFFIDNIDPSVINLERFYVKKTLFIFISKSGNTIETLAQLGMLKNISPNDILIITEDKQSLLREISLSIGSKFLPHPKNIGGRFSAFSITGILPCIICNFDAKQFRNGALIYKERTLDISRSAAVLSLTIKKKISSMPLITYSDRITKMMDWLIQLVSESLGKDGIGITPFFARGTFYQHSQLQLFLSGAKDKYFNIFSVNETRQDFDICNEHTGQIFTLKTMSDLLTLFKNSAVETLGTRKMPMREICIESLSASNIGATLAHLMLETVIAAKLLGINPFNQPDIEKIKTLLKQVLI